jgi:hypothetical protein
MSKTNMDWEIKNCGGVHFKFFIDEENRPCFSVVFEDEILANLIMSKKEFESLVDRLTEMMNKH